jgi:hypothetical protein
MDEKLITVAAEAAVNDLQLDCRVVSISQRKDVWCVKFSGSYGELCDEFRSRYGKENSAEVVREKLKRLLLKSPKPTGRRRGVSNRSTGAGIGSSLLDIPRQIAEDALEQTTRIAGAVINSTVNTAETAFKTVADAASDAGQAIIESPPLQAGIKIVVGDGARSSKTGTRRATTRRATKKAKKRVTQSATQRAAKKAAKRITKSAAKKSRKITRKMSGKKASKK